MQAELTDDLWRAAGEGYNPRLSERGRVGGEGGTRWIRIGRCRVSRAGQCAEDGADRKSLSYGPISLGTGCPWKLRRVDGGQWDEGGGGHPCGNKLYKSSHRLVWPGWLDVCMYICMRMNACNAVVVYGVMYPALSAKCRLPPSPRGALHRCVYAFSWVKNV